MWVLQRGRQTNFAGEAFSAQAFGQIGRQYLHDDVAPQRHISRYEYTGHPAAAQLAVQGVGCAECGLKFVAQGVGHIVKVHPRVSAFNAGRGTSGSFEGSPQGIGRILRLSCAP